MQYALSSSVALMALLALNVTSLPAGDGYEDEVLSDDPVVYYRFEEGDLGQAEDASGNDNEGEYFGGIEFEQPSATEGLGQAILLDGASGYLQMNPLGFEMDQMTIEVWVNLSFLAAGCCTSVFSPDDWQPGWLHYNIKNNATVEFALNGGGPNNHNTAPNTVPFNEWVHLASVYDREEAMVRTYVNGEEVDVVPPDFSSPQPVRFNVPAQVGAWQNTRFLGGSIDEFAVYDTALSGDRIRAHFEVATAGVDGVDTDADGVPDARDNCPANANSGQADGDGDGVGDECDICSSGDDSIDTDTDGIPDACDNCPAIANPDQIDGDDNGIGDACDDVSGFVRGDSNSSSVIDLTDGVVTLNFLFTGGPSPGCADAADTDDNGQLVISDAVITFSYLFTGGSAPVTPSPSMTGYAPGDCGPDPTDDPLDCAVMAATCMP